MIEAHHVVIDHGVITARTVSVATTSIPNARTTDTARAMVDIPGIGGGGPLMFSGARVSTPGEVEVYVANISGSNFTTGPVTYEVNIYKFTS